MKLRIALILTVVLLLASLSVPLYAQEATAEPTTTTSVEAQPEQHPVAGVAEEETQTVGNGATTLVLLIGLGAVAVVGLGAWVRVNNRQQEA